MFRSDQWQSDVARALLRDLGLEHLWTDRGPSDEGVELHDAGGGYLSTGERVILAVAFAVWNGGGGGLASIGDVVHRLDNRRLAIVGQLLRAIAHDQVDRWLAWMRVSHEGVPEPCPACGAMRGEWAQRCERCSPWDVQPLLPE